MKKVLFATTALVMTAGVAAAEVAVGGNGRMGVVYNGEDWNFSSRVRVAFTLSGQTDTGLEFGGSIRADNSVGGDAGTEGEIFISGAFGKIAMGDVVSAPEALFGDMAEVGYTDLESVGMDGIYSGLGSNDIPYLTLDNGSRSALLYTYSAGAFSVAVSMTDSTGNDFDLNLDLDNKPETGDLVGTTAYAIAGAYTTGNYTVGLGYEVLDWDLAGVKSTSQIELAGVATFGETEVKAYYADQKNGFVDKAFGLGVASKFGATGVSAYVQKAKDSAGKSITWYGLGASYDLGGGASVVGGIADNDVKGSKAVADLGVKFKF